VLALTENVIYLGDNAEILPALPDDAFQLIYVDPPFNTGKDQTRLTLATVPDSVGDRTGFQGRR
jgi:site-specific DNA-methyltransferase (adenine-specific)